MRIQRRSFGRDYDGSQSGKPSSSAASQSLGPLARPLHGIVSVLRAASRRALLRAEQGEPLTGNELADLLAFHDLPEPVRDSVINRLRQMDRPKKRRGRPGKSDLERWLRALRLVGEVCWLEASLRIQEHPRPKGRAIEVVADQNGISVSRLRDVLKRDLRDLPPVVRDHYGLYLSRDGRKWLEGHLRSLKETGRVRLDRIQAYMPQDDPDIRLYYEAKAGKRPPSGSIPTRPPSRGRNSSE